MGTKKFSPKRNFGKRNIGKIPEDKPVLYKIQDKKGDNIYTGISKRGQGKDRLKDHLTDGSDPIRGARSFQIKQKPSVDSAKKEESRIIKKEKPKYNKKAWFLKFSEHTKKTHILVNRPIKGTLDE